MPVVTRRLQTVCESAAFNRKAAKLWNREEHEEFVRFIAEYPRAGDLIEGTGGARKVRWARSGMGKRGGTRVITYFHDESLPVLLLMLFAKNERSDIGPDDKRELAAVIAEIKAQRKARRLS